MQTIFQTIIFTLCLFAFLVTSHSWTHQSLLRNYQNDHKMLGIKGQWTGRDCG